MKRKLLLPTLAFLILSIGSHADDVKDARLKELRQKLFELKSEKTVLEAKLAIPKSPEPDGAFTGNVELIRHLSPAVVIIEGDQSSGTGFIGATGGKKYIYATARVLSGNTRLTIRNSDGITFKKFGKLEAAQGADLVRMELLEEVKDFLQFHPVQPPVQINRKIVILGTDVKNRMVTTEEGLVLGTSADSLEVNGVPGKIKNDDGPVVDAATGEVVGLTTRTSFSEKTVWTEGTRQGQARRFACRLDRDWTWQPMTVVKFLADGKALKDHLDLMEICDQIASGASGHSSLNDDSKRYAKFADQELVRAYKEIATGQAGNAETKKKMRNLVAMAYSRAKNSKAALKPESFSWYHRTRYEAFGNYCDRCMKMLEQATAALK